MSHSRAIVHLAVKIPVRRAAAAIGRTAPARLLTLPHQDRRLLLSAVPMVLFVRLGLWLVPVTRLHRLLTARRFEIACASLMLADARRLAWAVTAVAPLIPSATCLTKALALQALLRRRGSPSVVHVGFASSHHGDVRGHAWLEWQAEVLLGGGELSGFRTVVELQA